MHLRTSTTKTVCQGYSSETTVQNFYAGTCGHLGIKLTVSLCLCNSSENFFFKSYKSGLVSLDDIKKLEKSDLMLCLFIHEHVPINYLFVCQSLANLDKIWYVVYL